MAGRAFRRLRMGLETVTGLRRQGFFVPYRYAGSVRAPEGYPAMERLLAAETPALEEMLDAIDGLAEALAALGGPAPQPRWEQDWFPRLDGAAAYALARGAPPARIVEVGSGHSTRFLARALADAGARAEQVCIDPAPRAALLDLPVTWRRELLSPAHMPLFEALEAGDMAVFDSSHLLMPGTDVDLILSEILPRLEPGVRVHVHDVFLPDGYPADWEWRGYSEQNGLAPWLLSGAYRPIHASRYALTRLGAAERPGIRDLPWTGAPESSLWMVRT
ncbi:class I SAM-dependent methyltransferase [Albimonas sp. CAU 1670]|uniref:class I SAM-dependent methyltransferase n=1 Tax=Albimonas sp. CAU 1670 TaxID=3032599 RepID=UPI0023DBCFE5|nr:class I SAM-dependent methyltransferase [Albimonas sp. CAU 1670]MDF2232865.1 class I SAM-dependent methyltransferase [Albimonas sp. CAU 1670]